MSEVENTVTVVIDGQELHVPKGQMIIQAADEAGVTIPRFCYHKKLSVAANCRMCLVDVEGVPKPLPACATPVGEGMQVKTKSKKAVEYQKSVMEFLLINHPLDCPICDQGGECELQDMAMGYGKDVSRYNQGKRVVKDHDIGPLIETDLTRCIHCTRCVRFGKEIAGIRELGMLGRGEHSEIGTFLHGSVTSEMSGNAIDLCPVGALTSKPFRYQARAWEMQQYPMVSPHDCVGSNVNVHVRRDQVMRVVPRENDQLNETWISDRDRFSYQALHSDARVTHPMIKRDGDWEKVSWVDAFEYIVKRFDAIKEQHGVDAFGALASPSSTTEELYLLQRLMRSFDCHNIDHRLKQFDFGFQGCQPLYPGIDGGLEAIDQADLVWVLGSDVRFEQPIIHHRLRQASLSGTDVCLTNPQDSQCRFDPTVNQLVNVDDMLLVVAGVLKALTKGKKKQTVVSAETISLLADVEIDPETKQIAALLSKAKAPVILVGEQAHHHPQASTLMALMQMLRQLTGAKGGMLTTGANAAGAWLAGALPHRGAGGAKVEKKGLDALQMLSEKSPLHAFLLLNVEPDCDAAYGAEAVTTLKQAQCVVALSAFFGDGLADYADVILPVGAFTETAGTYVNVTGTKQTFRGIANPPGDARPAWKVIRVLANFMELPHFEFASIDRVMAALEDECEAAEFKAEIWKAPKILPKPQRMVKRVATTPVYAVDALVRRAPALQKTALMQDRVVVTISSAMAEKLRVSVGDQVQVVQGSAELVLPVHIDASLPDRNVVLPMGLPEFAQAGRAFDKISLSKV